jgi:predicted RNase H-like HicB family nuclease
MNNKYALQIFWSEEDEGYIAVCQEFPGLSAFGETREEALCEAQIALDLMIETYQKNGIVLPEPQDILLAA